MSEPNKTALDRVMSCFLCAKQPSDDDMRIVIALAEERVMVEEHRLRVTSGLGNIGWYVELDSSRQAAGQNLSTAIRSVVAKIKEQA